MVGGGCPGEEMGGGRGILIMGGGIGGTAAAIALRNAGLEAVGYEARTRRGTQDGGCYVLWYAGALSLARLGVAERAHAPWHQLGRPGMCGARGPRLSSLDLGKRGLTPCA